MLSYLEGVGQGGKPGFYIAKGDHTQETGGNFACACVKPLHGSVIMAVKMA